MRPIALSIAVLALGHTFAAGVEPSSYDVLPAQSRAVFVATVKGIGPSQWVKTGTSLEIRTLPVRWQIEKVVKAPDARLKTIPKIVGSKLVQRRTVTGRVTDVEGFWSHHDPQPGDRYLMFAGGEAESGSVAGGKQETSAAGWPEWIADPIAAYEVTPGSPLVADAQFIVEGEALDTAAKTARLRDFLKKPGRSASFILSSYISSLTLASEGQAREDLIAFVPDAAYRALDEEGKAELLRTFHIGLLMQEAPASDAVDALTAACLRTLATTSLDEGGSPSQRAITAASLYLPWCLHVRASLEPAIQLARLTPVERKNAAAHLARLVEEQRIPRDVAASVLDASTHLSNPEAR